MLESYYARISLFALRVALGWVMLYAGLTKVTNPAWSAEGYLKNAKTFPELYAWFASPGILPVINFINEWGLTLLGASLIFGLFVRLSSLFGALLMLLYYFPVLTFPTIKTTAFIVDDHIVYAIILLFFAASRAGRVWGLEKWCSGLPICSKFPALRSWLG